MLNSSRSPRRAVAATLSVLVAAATLSFAPGTAGAVGAGNEAVLVNANAFVRNQYTEVGARPNGSFGSNVSQPAGWHGNFTPRGQQGNSTTSGVGFRADREKNGWGTGADDGDFFLPGQPYGQWSIQTSGPKKMNDQFRSDVPGGFVEADTSGDPSVVWDSADSSSGVPSRLAQSVPAVCPQQLNLDVPLTNPTSAHGKARHTRAVAHQTTTHGPETKALPGGWLAHEALRGLMRDDLDWDADYTRFVHAGKASPADHGDALRALSPSVDLDLIAEESSAPLHALTPPLAVVVPSWFGRLCGPWPA